MGRSVEALGAEYVKALRLYDAYVEACSLSYVPAIVRFGLAADVYQQRQRLALTRHLGQASLWLREAYEHPACQSVVSNLESLWSWAGDCADRLGQDDILAISNRTPVPVVSPAPPSNHSLPSFPPAGAGAQPAPAPNRSATGFAPTLRRLIAGATEISAPDARCSRIIRSISRVSR